MDNDPLLLEAPATTTAPALLLRPWSPADAAGLVPLYQDEDLRRWTSFAVDDEASAERWVREQQRGWEKGTCFAFAIVTTGDGAARGRLVGNTVLKRPVPDAQTAEVGYWTAAHARGRGVAPRALDVLTDWAFGAFADDGLTRLELLHQEDNTGSCRVAEKCRYAFSTLLPAAPPEYPRNGHLHVRVRDDDRRAGVG